MEGIKGIFIIIMALIVGWYLGYFYKEIIEPILIERRNKRLKKKYKESRKTWTTSWTPYKTTITIECTVNDSIDEKARDRLIKCLREQLEDFGTKVTIEDEDTLTINMQDVKKENESQVEFINIHQHPMSSTIYYNNRKGKKKDEN
jgi:hypothetical protein